MTRKPDYDELYRIAEAQAGYITFVQAREAGFTKQLLSHHAKVGRLRRVVPGIYRLAQSPEMPNADLFVAWLRTGPRSVISHESALTLYELSDILPSEIHITIPRTASHRRRGLRLHTNRITPKEIAQRAGLPVTTVSRTIADVIKSGLSQEQVERAISQSLSRGLITRQALRRYARQRGGRMARVIDDALQQQQAP